MPYPHKTTFSLYVSGHEPIPHAPDGNDVLRGAATFLITVPAMLPVYKRLHMRRETLLRRTLCSTLC